MHARTPCPSVLFGSPLLSTSTQGKGFMSEREDDFREVCMSTSTESSQDVEDEVQQGLEDFTLDEPLGSDGCANVACVLPVCLSLSSHLQLSPPAVVPHTTPLSQETVWVFVPRSMLHGVQLMVKLNQKGIMLWQSTLDVSVPHRMSSEGGVMEISLPLAGLQAGVAVLSLLAPSDISHEGLELPLLVLPPEATQEVVQLFSRMVAAIDPDHNPNRLLSPWSSTSSCYMDVSNPWVIYAYQHHFLPLARDVGAVLGTTCMAFSEFQNAGEEDTSRVTMDLLGFMLSQHPAMKSSVAAMIVSMGQAGILMTMHGYHLSPVEALETLGLTEEVRGMMTEPLDEQRVLQQVQTTREGLDPLGQSRPGVKHPRLVGVDSGHNTYTLGRSPSFEQLTDLQ